MEEHDSQIDAFIGWKSEDGKLEVIGIEGRSGQGAKLYKVTCTECSKDKELFPEGYFVSNKGNLIQGRKPCACSRITWKDWQYLILSRRTGEKKSFVVLGFAEYFHGKNTKLNLECLKDGCRWKASINNVVNHMKGCPKCARNYRPTEQEAFDKCKIICETEGYEFLGFPTGYKNVKSRLEYVCPNHGKQNVEYNAFVNAGSRCGGCSRDENIRRLRENGNGNGHYPKRKEEVDFLYVFNFNNKFIKVGRSFDIKHRINSLEYKSKIKNIKKLYVLTATHQEIYDLEQELHNELRERGFSYYVDWSTECFDNNSLDFIKYFIQKSGLKTVG